MSSKTTRRTFQKLANRNASICLCGLQFCFFIYLFLNSLIRSQQRQKSNERTTLFWLWKKLRQLNIFSSCKHEALPPTSCVYSWSSRKPIQFLYFFYHQRFQTIIIFCPFYWEQKENHLHSRRKDRLREFQVKTSKKKSLWSKWSWWCLNYFHLSDTGEVLPRCWSETKALNPNFEPHWILS